MKAFIKNCLTLFRLAPLVVGVIWSSCKTVRQTPEPLNPDPLSFQMRLSPQQKFCGLQDEDIDDSYCQKWGEVFQGTNPSQANGASLDGSPVLEEIFGKCLQVEGVTAESLRRMVFAKSGIFWNNGQLRKTIESHLSRVPLVYDSEPINYPWIRDVNRPLSMTDGLDCLETGLGYEKELIVTSQVVSYEKQMAASAFQSNLLDPQCHQQFGALEVVGKDPTYYRLAGRVFSVNTIQKHSKVRILVFERDAQRRPMLELAFSTGSQLGTTKVEVFRWLPDGQDQGDPVLESLAGIHMMGDETEASFFPMLEGCRTYKISNQLADDLTVKPQVPRADWSVVQSSTTRIFYTDDTVDYDLQYDDTCYEFSPKQGRSYTVLRVPKGSKGCTSEAGCLEVVGDLKPSVPMGEGC